MPPIGFGLWVVRRSTLVALGQAPELPEAQFLFLDDEPFDFLDDEPFEFLEA